MLAHIKVFSKVATFRSASLSLSASPPLPLPLPCYIHVYSYLTLTKFHLYGQMQLTGASVVPNWTQFIDKSTFIVEAKWKWMNTSECNLFQTSLPALPSISLFINLMLMIFLIYNWILLCFFSFQLPNVNLAKYCENWAPLGTRIWDPHLGSCIASNASVLR